MTSMIGFAVKRPDGELILRGYSTCSHSLPFASYREAWNRANPPAEGRWVDDGNTRKYVSGPKPEPLGVVVCVKVEYRVTEIA